MSTDILGVRYDTPIVLAPVGGHRAFHAAGEEAVEYTSLDVAEADRPRVDELLNEMGQDRWDRYHVGESGQGRACYFNRNKTNTGAYLTNLFRLGAVTC
jgi:hypothetical protein